MKSAKDEVREILDLLPEDCTIEDVQHHMHVRARIREGIWSLENERTYTQEEMEGMVAQWLADEDRTP
jgi:hypothetical protein